MKVAHLDTGRDWRGGQNQIALLTRGLAARGIASVVLAPPGPLLERMAAEGVPAHAWRARGDLDLVALARARAILARERPDVVHLHSGRAVAVGVPAARLAGVRAVVASRRVAFPPRRSIFDALKRALPVDRWLCVSEAARRMLVASGIDVARTRVVPSGVDLEELAAAAARPAPDLRAMLGVTATAPLLVTVGALTPEKGHAALLAAAHALATIESGAHWVWIGDGPQRAALERARHAFALEDRVHLLGHRDDVAALVRQCTLLVVASEHEGFCTAAVEAQALGVPVVATRVGGLPEVVADGETGVLVPWGDAAAMAGAVAGLLAQPERIREMAARAPDVARRFAAERMVQGTLDQYQEVVRSVAPAS